MGHDVLTSYDAGNANKCVSDVEVIEFAPAQRRITLTANRKHFIKLHRDGLDHAGIVVFTDGHQPVPTASRIDMALNDSRATGRFLAKVDGLSHTFDP
jgi:hypothetical protein